MKAYTVFSILAAAVLLCSCEDKLDIPQKGVTNVENFYQTDEDAMEAITAVYNNWRTTFVNGFLFKNLLADDLHKGGAWRDDNLDYENVYESVLTPANSSHVETYFSNLYSTIYLANLITDKFTAESAVKSRVLSEAKFFRAYCYFELVTLWGRAPLVTHVLNPDEYRQPNGDIPLLWAQIEQDLTEVINSDALPSKKDVNDNETNIRITREAATAYLGKAYLYEGKNKEAMQELLKVVTSAKYELIDDFGALYHMEADNCKEYVIETNRHFDTNNLFAQGGLLGVLINWTFNSFLTVKDPALAMSFYDFKIDQGFGFMNPTQTLRDAFLAEEGEEGYRLNLSMRTWEQLMAMGMDVIEMGVAGNEGLWRWKYLPKQSEEFVIAWGGNFSNTPVLRYADVLLMLAEACVKTNNPDADNYLNIVRTRAKLSPKLNITLEDVKLERRLELAMEALRFQDLSRWGDAPSVLADKGKKLPTFRVTARTAEGLPLSWGAEYADNEKPDAGFTPGRDEYLPFPQTEINVNDWLEQNPGY
jgi:hypothetical protein